MKSIAAAEVSSSIVSIRFLVSGAGVFDRLLADLAEARIDGRIVLVGGLALEHAARARTSLDMPGPSDSRAAPVLPRR